VDALRIGELSRRTGVSPDLLRAWERRYGLLRPVRTAGGFRVYSGDDERRVRDMQHHLARGLAAAEAARLVATDGSESPAAPEELLERLLAFDDDAANRLLDRAVSSLSAEAVLQELVLPVLRRIGDGWERGEVSIAQEHFASNLVRGRLLGLARRWDQGGGPRALLACAPGELHDIPLLAFGIALRARGWRIVYLGADTPLETLREAATTVKPDLVVVAASRSHPAVDLPELRRLGELVRLVLAGPWETPAWAFHLDGDPVEAARAVALP
jgi:DNA-binding transcriptional MerR regulator